MDAKEGNRAAGADPQKRDIESEVRERFITILTTQISSVGPKYKYLEKRYGISARRWQNVYNRTQLPGMDMLVSILDDYPYLTTWILFGKPINTLQIDPTEEGWERKLMNEFNAMLAAQQGVKLP